MKQKQERFKAVWEDVEAKYKGGYCVSERALQAYLFARLEAMFPKKKVVVEPCWIRADHRCTPDIVMLAESECHITDIFELKFTPHEFADFESDVLKLLGYTALESEAYSAKIDPGTGKWQSAGYSLSENCELHFAVIANWDAGAVWPDEIKKAAGTLRSKYALNHWYGRVAGPIPEKDAWGIKFDVYS